MLFNSLDFALFFTLFFFVYWYACKSSVRLQNIALLIGSYLFYAYWDWQFLFLLVGSTLVNYFLAICISSAKTERQRNVYLYLGLIQGLGCLFLFKYYNFFIQSTVEILQIVGFHANLYTLNLILPLGISFYTFRTLSYLLDIHKGKYEPTKDAVVFFSYVAFFPSLLSGPIDRPNQLIPQLEKKRVFNQGFFTDGMRQILWGLFKKVVIADNCATFTAHTFDNYEALSGSTLLFSAFLYAVQLYTDFSGYSEMAIGFSKLLGIRGTQNFNYPFFAQNIAEYWRRWHMSLTSWLTEYVFTPLSITFRDHGKIGLFLAILFNFIFVGLWHGANWTYVIFGVINGCLYIPLILAGTMNKKKPIAKGKILPNLREMGNVILTFTIVMLTDILFRSESFSEAIEYVKRMLSSSLVSIPEVEMNSTAKFSLVFIPILFIVEWVQREQEFGLKIERINNGYVRLLIYVAVVSSIFMFGAFSNKAFIYFQF